MPEVGMLPRRSDKESYNDRAGLRGLKFVKARY
jgi:hypothetical protein